MEALANAGEVIGWDLYDELLACAGLVATCPHCESWSVAVWSGDFICDECGSDVTENIS